MKTIITLDKADQPYGFPQLDGNSELHITGSLNGTASYAINSLTASYLSGYVSPFPYTGSAQITGSLGVTGSLVVTDSINGLNIGVGRNSISSNIAIGSDTLTSNTTGYNNIAQGDSALVSNTTGYDNIALGAGTLVSNTTGNSNIAQGPNALILNTEGSHNIAQGAGALFNNSIGNYNIGLGQSAGQYDSTGGSNTSGQDSIFIGKNTKPLTTTNENQIVIGNGAVGLGSNTVVLGNDSIVTTALKGTVIVSGSQQITGSLTVTQGITGSLFGTASFATNALSASWAPIPIFDTGSLLTTSSFNEFSASYNTGSFTGSFTGDGSGLVNIPASGIIGLNLSQISSGSVSASISPGNGLEVNTDIKLTTGGFLYGNTGDSSLRLASGVGSILRFANSNIGLYNTLAEIVASNRITHLIGASEITRVTSAGLGIGTTVVGARLDVRAQGALSTDIAFRVRNSADTADIISVKGNQDINFALSAGQTAAFGGAAGAMLLLNGTSAAWISGTALIYGGGQSFIQLRTAGSPRVQIDNLGNTSITRLRVGAGTFQASAILQSDSTTQGFLPPRMTTTQRNAISSPAEGLVVYSTGSSNDGLNYYNSGSQIGWHKLISNTGSQSITGSLTVTQGITGSLFGTASFASTASFVNTLNQNVIISGSLKLDPTQDPDPTGLDLDSTVLFQSSSNTALGYDLYIRQNGNLVKWKWIEGSLETGLLYGGVVTYSGSNVFISPGSGIIAEHNATTSSEVSPMIEYVTWNAITQSVANIATQQVTYLYIDNTGALQQQSTRFTSQQYHSYIPLGAVGHFDYTQVSAFGGSVQTAYDQISQTSNFIDAFGPLKKSGYGLTGQAGSLRLSVGSGTSFIHGGFYQNDPEFPSEITTPSQVTASMARVNRSGSSILFDTNGGNLYTAVDPTQYDRDGDGVLHSVGSGNWSIQRVFSDPKTGVLYVYYGQARYTSLLNALQYLPTDPFTEGDTFDFTTFIGFLVLKGNASDITDTANNSIINAGLFRGSGQGSGGGIALSNLEDLTDVSVTSPTNGQALIYDSGIWQNGTPLNATSASFASTASYLETPTLTNGSVLFSNGTTIEQDNANLFWDNTNNRLGIGTSSPQQRLHINGSLLAGSSNTSGLFFNIANDSLSISNYRIVVKSAAALLFGNNNSSLSLLTNSLTRLYIDNSGNIAVGATTAGARLDVRAQGALSTDIAFRVRNSADTINLLDIKGNGQVEINSTKNSPALFLKGNSLNTANDFVELTFGATGTASRLAAITGVFVNPASNLRTHLTFSTTGASFGEGMRLTDNKNLLIGTTTDSGVRLDVRAQGALSTDIALRVRDSGDTTNLLSVTGNGRTTIIGGNGDGVNNGVLVVQNTTAWSGFQWIQTWKNSAGTSVASLSAQGGFSTAAAISGLSLTATSGGNATFRAISVNSTSGFYGSTGINFVTNNLHRGSFTNNGNFVIGTTTDIASSKLTVESTTQGFLPPRMTNAQRLAIASPAIGLMVYCTDETEGLYINKSTGWTFVI